MLNSVKIEIDRNKQLLKDDWNKYKYIKDLFYKESLLELNFDELNNILKYIKIDFSDCIIRSGAEKDSSFLGYLFNLSGYISNNTHIVSNDTISKIFCKAAQSGSLENLKYLVGIVEDEIIQNIICQTDSKFYNVVYICMHPNIIKYIFDLINNTSIKDNIISNLFTNGSEYLHYHGNYLILEFLIESSSNPNIIKHHILDSAMKFIIAAGYNGDLNTLNFILDLSPNLCEKKNLINITAKQTFSAASTSDKLEFLKSYTLLIQDSYDIIELLKVSYHSTFYPTADKGHIRILKYILDLCNSDELRNELIHKDDDRIFCKSSYNNNLDMLKFLFSVTPDIDARNKMIHACNDDPFCSTRSISIRNFLLENTIDDKTKHKMIHAQHDQSFRSAVGSNNIDNIKYLVDLTPNLEVRTKMLKRSVDIINIPFKHSLTNFENKKYFLKLFSETNTMYQMIHGANDVLFLHSGARSKIETKYICMLDPFYKWPKLYWNGYNPKIYKKLAKTIGYYKKIDILSLRNISICSKNLLSASKIAKPEEEDKPSMVDLPIDLIFKILQKVAGVNTNQENKLYAAIKAYTYDTENYSGGFKGFTVRYEKYLEDIIGDNI